MSEVATCPDVTGPVERVMARELFTGLLIDDAGERATALDAVLGKVVDDETRVVWIGNPLRSPLTIERFLIQIVGPEIDLREERTPAELARIIATPTGHETRLLLVVQQPETIGAETIQLLVQMAWYLASEAVRVQFLFAGSSAFVVPRVAAPGLLPFSWRWDAEEPGASQTAPRRRDIVPLVLLLIAVTIGVLFSIAPVSPDGTLAVTPAPSTIDVALLRREFEAFLAQRTPPLPPLSKRERAALFTEMLTNRGPE